MVSEHGKLPAVPWPAPWRVWWQVLSQRLGQKGGVFWVWKAPDLLRSAVTMKKPEAAQCPSVTYEVIRV